MKDSKIVIDSILSLQKEKTKELFRLSAVQGENKNTKRAFIKNRIKLINKKILWEFFKHEDVLKKDGFAD